MDLMDFIFDGALAIALVLPTLLFLFSWAAKELVKSLPRAVRGVGSRFRSLWFSAAAGDRNFSEKPPSEQDVFCAHSYSFWFSAVGLHRRFCRDVSEEYNSSNQSRSAESCSPDSAAAGFAVRFLLPSAVLPRKLSGETKAVLTFFLTFQLHGPFP